MIIWKSQKRLYVLSERSKGDQLQNLKLAEQGAC